MAESDLQRQIDALKAEIAEMKRTGLPEPRLGPRQETQEDLDARTSRMVDVLTNAVAGKKAEPPPVDRSKLCTTSGESPEKVRAEQTNETGQHTRLHRALRGGAAEWVCPSVP